MKTTTNASAVARLKGGPRQNRDEVPLERENNNLEELALLQLGLIYIQVIAEYNEFINNRPGIQPLPLVSEPFWSEFNQWRQDNPNEYDNWLNTRNLPAPDNADANNATSASRDNAPGDNHQQQDDTSTDGGFSSSSYATTITITGTWSSTFSYFSSSSSTDSFQTAQTSQSTDESFFTCPDIQTPPSSLSVLEILYVFPKNHTPLRKPNK